VSEDELSMARVRSESDLDRQVGAHLERVVIIVVVPNDDKHVDVCREVGQGEDHKHSEEQRDHPLLLQRAHHVGLRRV
jgi:hypothetical protein